MNTTVVCAALIAWMAIIWISGDAGTALQTKHGGLQGPWWGSTQGISTLNYGMGNDIPTAMVEEKMPDIQLMRSQEWDPGVLARGMSTLNYGLETDITTVLVVDMMPDILRMGFQEWDPGVMDTDSEMYLHEGMHRVHMANEVIWGYVITGIVMEWDTKQQCHERAMMGGLFKEDEALG